MNITIQLDELKGKCLLTILTVFFLYVFWYQYAYNPISGTIPILTLIMTVLALPHYLKLSDYAEICGFLCFTICCAFISLLIGSVRSESSRLIFNQIEYLVPLIVIYTFASGGLENFKSVNRALCLAVLVLAIHSKFFGIKTNTGAVVIGTLNANVIASLLTLGTVSALILIAIENSNLLKCILLIAISVMSLTMFDVGSRRGIVLQFYLLFSGLAVFINERFRGKIFVKLVAIIAFLFFLFFILLNIEALFGDSVAIQRLIAGRNAGDIQRERLQAIAWKIFMTSPIFGQGLGVVGVQAGMYAHSLYYEVLASSGVLGMFLLTLFFFKHIFVLFRCARLKNTSEVALRRMCMLLVSSIVVIFLTGMFVVLIYDMYFYVMIAIVSAGVKIAKKGAGERI